MRKGLLNLRQKFQQLFTLRLHLCDGGLHRNDIVLGVLYFLIAIFNLFDKVIFNKPFIAGFYDILPFVIASILMFTKHKEKTDLAVDFLLSMTLIGTSTLGDMTGIPVLFLIIFRLYNNKHKYILFGISFIFICVAAMIEGWGIPSVFVMIAVYGFMLYKYYYIIHKPTESLKATIKDLQSELYKRGPVKQLTDDQIIQKYPFMYHPRDNKYRRIEDVRMLADGLSVKEIASIAEVEPNTISREFDDLKVNIGVFTDNKIMSKEQLIKVCIELGIIEVTFIHR